MNIVVFHDLSSLYLRHVYAAVCVNKGFLGLSGFSWFPDFSLFPFVYKQMLRWFPPFQVATTCFPCSPPDINLLVTNFIFCIHVR